MNPTAAGDAPPTSERIYAALRQVIDPEAGINIVDLGLVYDVRIETAGVHVALTMTSPTCPMGDLILDEVRQVLAGCLPAGWAQDVRLVWEPPWGPEKMSEQARAHFGWEG